MTNMWMVRSGKSAFLIEEFKENNLVAIGWELGDLSDKSDDEISSLYLEKYGDTNSLNQVLRFKNDIEIGDYVITAGRYSQVFYLGKITSDYYYSTKVAKTDVENDHYFDVRDVEWLCEIEKDQLESSTQSTLKTPFTVFKINENAKEDILMNYKNDIKQIRTVTLSKNDPDSPTYDAAINYLSEELINQREGHFHYINRNVNLIGKTLVLFKYGGKLIAKGIFCDEIKEQVNINNITYNGYYVVEKDSIGIFDDFIEYSEVKKYIPDIKSMNRDQVIDIKYLENVNSMIEKHLNGSTKNQYDFSAKIIRNYLDENNLSNFENPEVEQIHVNFRKLFAPEILEKLEGADIINKIFLHDGDKNTLCYNLEFSHEFMRGGIGGGSALKYSLYKSNKTNQWTTGTPHKQKTISESEAIEIGSKIRDALVNGAHHIENVVLNSINDYIALEDDLNNIFKNCKVKATSSWVHKYYVLLFPDKFQEVHSDGMKKEFLRKFRIEPQNGYYANDGQFILLSRKAGIKLYSLFTEEIVGLFYIGEHIWDPIEKGVLVDITGKLDISIKSEFKCDKKRNLIYFGAPGTGKSYNLNKEKDKLLENYPNNYERVTFHPDYSYANFVGTYKPVPENKTITYKYVPGPFMRVLKKAIDNPAEPFLLLIEEINRANVAAVFGDVFQLLDRENNESMYPIDATEDMKEYINKDKITIPKNMFIWATMNSADQGVFPMDTAFKRRWDFAYFSINNNDNEIEKTFVKISDKVINWNDLRKSINTQLLSYKLNEDKLIGPFFALNEYHNKEIPIDIFKDIFKNKIIMYLFEDAARPKRNELFSGACEICDTKNITYSEICDLIDDDKIIEIFTSNIRDEFSPDED